MNARENCFNNQFWHHLASCLVVMLLLGGERVHAQQPAERIGGDRLGGFVLPIEPIQTPLSINALRAWSWTIDDTKRLLVEGDVAIHFGGYSFTSANALIWINRIPSAETGRGLINQIAIYFDRTGDHSAMAGMGGLDAGGARLLVTGSTRGEVALNVAHIIPFEPHRSPPQSQLLDEGEARLADYLRSLLTQPPPLRQRPLMSAPAPDLEFVPLPGQPIVPVTPLAGEDQPLMPSARTWLGRADGVVRFSAGRVEVTRGELENTITATGGVLVEIVSDNVADLTSNLTLTGERAVIFLEPGALVEQATQLSANSVRGVYLEGHVMVLTHSGEYFLRAPQAYYDFGTQQAILVDSLLRLQSRAAPVPVHARAQELRQLAQGQWEAKRVTVSTSEFYKPHLAVGAGRATITRNGSTQIDAHDVTINALTMPIFIWPRIKGDPERVPLRHVEIGSRRNDGVRLLTTWDVFALAGIDAPEGFDADLKVDAFTKRGVGIGSELRYNVGDSEGRVDVYGLYDTGVDRTSSGMTVDPQRTLRGVTLLDEHQMRLGDFWTLQVQASLISDETFISTWREDDFAERREYETSFYLKHQRDNAALTFLGQYSLQDFISNSYLLASRQYTVDRVPELTYRRYGDSLFGDALTYSTENRLSRMRLVFVQATPNELGVPAQAFGIGPDELIADALFADGLRESWVTRFDSRHELAWPLRTGAFNITPFVVGRFTWYNDEFQQFSDEGDSMRFYGAAGVRISAPFQRVHNRVENRLFDLHRVRHIIEPYLTAWVSHTSVEQQHVLVYDETVESLADGAALQLGVRHTWQTQRGGPGRWRSVDWLTLDTSVVIDSEGEPNESPTPQFFEYRPEYSYFGDHIRTRGRWQLSDSLTMAADSTYVLNDSEFARGSIGMELRHSPVLLTYLEYRFIDANDLALLDIGWRYQLTPKYYIVVSPQWDLNADRFRAATMRLTRRFPDVELTFIVRYDSIRDDTLIGASLGLTQF